MARWRSRLGTADHRPDNRALSASLLALALLLPAWWLASRWYGERLLQQVRADAAIETSLRGNALSSVINRRMARLQGLHAFIQVELSEADFPVLFEEFASGLYAGTRGIRHLAVAPGGVVRYVYPMAGNEAVVGSHPSQDPRPEVRLDVRRTIESREVALTCPLESQAGSQDLMAWQAVYQGGAYWGLVSMALDLPALLEEAGLSEPSGSLGFALRSGPSVLFGSEQVFDSDPVFSVIRFPDDAWELAAAPLEGWLAAAQAPLQVFQVAGLIITGLVASLAYLSVNRQARLALAVEGRTRQIAAVNLQLQQDIAERERAEAALSEREAQYRSIFESVSDGLLILDLEGRLVDFNPAAARMHGYSPADSHGLAAEQVIHPESMPLFRHFLQVVAAGLDFRGRLKDLRHDGSRSTPFHVEVWGTGFTYRGRPHALAVLRDVTEEVQAYQLLEQRVQERTEELATLLDVSANIASTLELKPLLGLILEQLQHVIDFAGASVLILEGEELRTVVHRGPIPEEALADMRLSREQAKELWDALQGHEPLIIDDVREERWLAQAFRQAFGEYLEREMGYVRTWLGVPLMVQDRLIGWLSLHHGEPQAYAQHHTALAQTIANQAAIAIDNARLYEQARRLAAIEERQRLARELHDSVSQVLYGIGLGARTAIALLGRAAVPPALEASLAEPLNYVLSLAEAGLTEMRALIFELRPDSLEREGLVAALTRQAESARVRHKLEVHTEFGAEPELPFEAKEALYRISQEALNNVAKHARARQVELCLQDVAGGVTLEVGDDGVGFDPEGEFPGHMGLRSMRERVARLGGSLTIESSPGQGTRIQVRAPRVGRG